MKRLLIAALIAISLPAVARTRAVRSAVELPPYRSVIWIAAHPDDESLVAPLLDLFCREQHAACTMLILTRGEHGACLLPNGCQPDVASVRSAEAAAASQFFNATLVLLTLPDGGGIAPPAWANDESVVDTIAHQIDAAHPDVIFTFDPRHGTTCHPDHRAVASLVLDALPRLAHQPDVYLLETRLNPSSLRFDRATSSRSVIRFDAASRWSAITEDMQRHPSQFDDAWLNAIASIPFADRAVYVAHASAILDENVSGCD